MGGRESNSAELSKFMREEKSGSEKKIPDGQNQLLVKDKARVREGTGRGERKLLLSSVRKRGERKGPDRFTRLGVWGKSSSKQRTGERKEYVVPVCVWGD